MDLKIKKSIPCGNIKAPTSKSYTHRYLLAASLGSMVSYISDVEVSDDIKATISAIKSLGREVSISGNTMTIGFGKEENEIDCNESGSTLRFIIPIILALNKKVKINAKPRLLERGIEIYEELFPDAIFEKHDDYIMLSGKITPNTYYLRANVSSQYLSGLLFALPLLDGDSRIVLTTVLESKNYIDITIDVLNKAGITIIKEENGYYIPGNQKYQQLNVTVEADASNSSFLAALNYLGGHVNITNINENSIQGDYIYKEYLEKLDKSYQIIDLANAIDLAPVLFVFSSLKHGAHFTNTRRLAIKESNRSTAVRDELLKIGVKMIVTENDVYIEKSELTKPSSSFSSHNDHRLVMALTLVSTYFDIVITDSEAINKSYPSFLQALKILGVTYEAN